MAEYLYRCRTCGAQALHHTRMTQPVPERLPLLTHQQPGTETPCTRPSFQRVYEPVRTNLGYRGATAGHTQFDAFRFRHLADD